MKIKSKFYVLIDTRNLLEENYNICDTIVRLSQSKDNLEKYVDEQVKETEEWQKNSKETVEKSKETIRDYLLSNLDAIDGWKHVGKLTSEEKLKIVDFLVASYSYCFGKNIVETKYDDSFIPKYCDVDKLTKPYPKITPPLPFPKNYIIRDSFQIKEIELT